MNTIADFIAGWFGGIAGLVIGHPADTIKVRQQSMNEKFFTTIRNTMKYEGFLGFYKGMLGPFLSIGPSNAVFFMSYGYCLRQFQHPSDHHSDSQQTARVDLKDPRWVKNVFISGAIAGSAQVIVTCPSELVKTVMQTHTDSPEGKWKPHYEAPYHNSMQATLGIWRKYGIRGFFKGGLPMLLRDVPTSGVYMYVYETLLPRENPNLVKQVLAGGTAGVISWMGTVPFDVMKSRLQSDNPRNPQYKGLMDCFRKSYKAEGAAVFFKGFWLIVARAFPTNAAILLGYETCSKLFKNILPIEN